MGIEVFIRSTAPSTHSPRAASEENIITFSHFVQPRVRSTSTTMMMTEQRSLQQEVCLDHARRNTDIPTTITTGRMRPATISPIEEGSAAGDPEGAIAPHRRPFKKRLRDIHKFKHSFRLIDDEDDEDDHDYDSDAASHPPSLERQSATVYAVTESHQVALVKQVSCRTIPRVQSWKPSGPPRPLFLQQSNRSVEPVPLSSDCYSKLYQTWSPLSRKSHIPLYPSLNDLADCCEEYQWKQQEEAAPPALKSSNSFRKKACPGPTKKQCKEDLSTGTTSITATIQQRQPTPTRVTPTEHSFAVVERPPQSPAAAVGRRTPLPKQRYSLTLAEPKECSRTSFEKLQQSDSQPFFSKDHHKNSQDRLMTPSRDRSVRRASTSKLFPPIETHHDETSDDEESEVEFQFQFPKFLRAKDGRDSNVTVQSSIITDILVIPPRRPPTTPTQQQSSQRDIVFSPPQSNAKKMPPLAATNTRMTSACPKAPPPPFRSAKPSVASGAGRHPVSTAHSGLKSPPPPSSIDTKNPSSSQREICFPGAAGPPKPPQLKFPPPFVSTSANRAREIQLAGLKQPPAPQQQHQYAPSTHQEICLPGPQQNASAAISQQAQQITIPAVVVHQEIRVLPASHRQILPPGAPAHQQHMRHSVSPPQDICLPGAQAQQHHAKMKPPQQQHDNAYRRGSAPVILSSPAAPNSGPALFSPRPSPGCNKPSSDRYFSPTNNHQMVVANIYPPPPFSPVSAPRRSAFFAPPKAAKVFAPPAVNAFAPQTPPAANINTDANASSNTTNKKPPPANLLCTPLVRRVSDLSMSSFQAQHENTIRRQCFSDQQPNRRGWEF